LTLALTLAVGWCGASAVLTKGGTLEIETLKAMNEGMYLSLLMMIEVIVLITVFCAIAGFAIYLAGIAWLRLRGNATAPRRQMKPVPEPRRELSRTVAPTDTLQVDSEKPTHRAARGSLTPDEHAKPLRFPSALLKQSFGTAHPKVISCRNNYASLMRKMEQQTNEDSVDPNLCETESAAAVSRRVP
jgi:hypothetical protein